MHFMLLILPRLETSFRFHLSRGGALRGAMLPDLIPTGHLASIGTPSGGQLRPTGGRAATRGPPGGGPGARGVGWGGAPGAVPNREMRLDYCFVSTRLTPAVRDVWVDRAALGSDHYPVWVEIDI